MSSGNPVGFDPFAGPAIAQVVPTTESQREIFTATRLGDEASLAFNESGSLRFSGPLDEAALRGAWGDLLSRHEVLRSTVSGDGRTLLVSPAAPPELPLLDLSGLPETERATRLDALRTAEVERPFDLERGPLTRATLVRLAPEEHVFVFTSHHIVCDGFSTGVMLRDLGALYTARRSGKPSKLPEPFGWGAWAKELEDWQVTEEHAADEKFWTGRFADLPPDLDLPADRRRPPMKTYAADRYDHVLAAALVERLRKAGAKNGASLFVSLLAGFEALLYRLSGQADLVVAIPSAGQAVGGHPTLVGHCVNTLPVRTVLDGEASFAKLLGAVRTAMLDAQDHSLFTLGELLRKLPIARDPSRLPLSSVCFNLDQGLPGASLGFEGLRVSFGSNPRRFENFDLFVNAVELEGSVTLEIQYNTDLYEGATVRRWAAALETLLAGAAEAPETPVWKLPVLPPAEVAKLDAWNGTRVAVPQKSLRELVEAQVARSPQAIAVLHESGEELSYADLDARANRLAHRLRELSVGPNVVVGLCLERTPDMVVAMLAVAKAGGGYLPLDPTYPADRLAFMLSDAKAPVLVTQERLRALLPDHGAKVVSLDGDAAALSAKPPTPPPPPPNASLEDVAYVIYTSGSTGRPKGVLVPVRAVANLLHFTREKPGMSAKDTVVAITTLSFDIAVFELWLPLAVGARILLASKDAAADGAMLLDLCKRCGATILQATPATWRLLIGAGWSKDVPLKVISTGEALPLDLGEQLVERSDDVWDMYGPTETTVWSTWWKVPRPLSQVLIGKPLCNTQLYILDRHMQRVPVGAVGELYIGGTGVALGYHDRPDLNAERFVEDPFLPGSRMYKTGDLARFRDDGDVEYLGRNDHQVKVRGFRIELGEIEAVLSRHPNVKQAVMLAREDRPGDVRLVAYVTGKEGAAPGEDELRDHAKRFLPQFMVPQHFVRLDAFPLTPNGKVDKKALPAPDGSASKTEYAPPRTEAEKRIAAMWAESLGLPRVGIHDNFFHLGGHSLLASQMITRLAREDGIAVPLRKIFEAPTVAQFAPLLSGSRKAERIPRLEGNGPWPLSLVQRRLWMLEQLDPGRMVWNLPSAFRLKGRINVPALEKAVEEFVRRHEAVRAKVRWEGDVPVLDVGPAPEVKLPVEDLTHLPLEADRLEMARRLIVDDVRRPFDLSAGKLYRVRLFKIGEDDHLIMWIPHHFAWDGWCFDLFLKEIDALYDAFRQGKTPPLKAPPVRYFDFAAWHETWLETPEVKKQAQWWNDQLGATPTPLELPTDRPRRPRQGEDGDSILVHVPAADVEAIKALGLANDATIYMVTLAAYVALLSRWSGQDDVVVATPVRGRVQPDVEDVVGPFVNTLVLRNRLDGDPTFRELLARVRASSLDAFSHQDVPFEHLAMSRNPAYRAFFSFQDARGRPRRIGDLDMVQFHVLQPAASTDVSLWVMESPAGHLAGGLTFATAILDRYTMERFLKQWHALLRDAVQHPDRPVSQLALQDTEDRRQLLARGEGPALVGALSSAPAHIDALLEKDGQAPAVLAGGKAVTRAELDVRARRVAQGLKTLTDGAEPAVAILMERSPAAVAAVLGTWKAGMAAMPLDPMQPAERLARILADGRPAAVVASRSQLAALPSGNWRALAIEDLEAAEPAARQAPPGADALALVLYVPGPGGEPCGVELTHGALAAGLVSARGALGLSEGEVVAAAAPAGGPRSLLETWLPLVTGARLALAPREAVQPRALAAFLQGVGTSLFVAPAPVFRQLLAVGFAGGSSFRAAVEAPLDDELAAALTPRADAVLEVLCTAEAAGVAAVRRADATGKAALSVAPGFRMRVVDRSGELVPEGIPGEVALGGPAVARGYRGRPALASERVIAVEGERLWRTGEWARWHEGLLAMKGRRDGRSEVRGVRFEPAELETALMAHPAVADAAVAAREDRPGEVRVTAYVVPHPGAAYTDSELRAHLRSRVPEALAPQHVVELAAIPRRANGAVDRAALPAPARGASGPKVDPRTDAEKLVAALWRQALGITSVSVSDNFFELGGHSLACLQMLSRLERETGKRLSPRAVLLDSLEQLAARVTAPEGTARTT
ncbi:MAG TPA: amino acid adenylation domain-containing protein [Anaeromyxobacteraceae bacterium]|nr:amino acid adenylation domain-containing protein [Anaeromyxobacteraceae bacterium]